MRNKILGVLVCLFWAALPSFASQTAVTATVTDANGNVYANGRYTITYQAGATLQTGATPLSVSGVLTSGGALAVTLWDNSSSGSTYLFNICSENGLPCFSLAITITGTSQSVSTELAAAAASLTNTTPGSTVTLSNQIAPVGTPATGNIVVYGKTSDKKLYYKNADGTEVGPLASTTGGTPPFSAITAGTSAVALVVGTSGSLAVSGSGTIAATSVTGTVKNCGTTTVCAVTAVTTPKIAFGTVAFSSGTPSTATLTALPFTSTASYVCTVTEVSDATKNLIKVANASASSTVITGPNTITDTVGYVCVGS